MPDARCTRGPVCKMGKGNAHEHTGSAENIRHALRNGFTAYFELSPEYLSGFLASVAFGYGLSAPGRADLPPKT